MKAFNQIERLGTCMGAWLFACPWLRHSPWSVRYSRYFELFADC
jgi:hypothetical protein